MSRRRSAWASIATALVLFHSAGATADVTDAQTTAQSLFERGKALVEHGSFAEACPKFAESLRLDPGLGVKLWLADCYENVGETASAWVQFKEAAAEAVLRHDPREAIARARAQSLEGRLPWLAVMVPREAAAPGIEVLRDGVPLGPAAWGLGVPLNPGVHTIAARAPGRAAWSTSVKLAPGTNPVLVSVPVLAPLASEAPTPALAPEVRVDPPPAPRNGNGQRIAGLAVAGTGVAGLVIGTVFSLKAKSTYDDSNAGHCLPDNECDATGKQDRSQASSMATVATVAFGLGAAAVVGGAALYFFAPKKAQVSVALAPSPHGGALRLAMSW